MTEVVGGPSVPEPSEIRALKQCLLCRNHSREQHGVAASCLEELRSKACDILAIDKSLAPVTLVLAEDGTIVDDDDYFLCLPANTKFVALAGNEKWAYNNSDGGTAWITQESFDRDETDSGAGLKWKNVARQLKEDLSSIILLSEEDLQGCNGEQARHSPCSNGTQVLVEGGRQNKQHVRQGSVPRVAGRLLEGGDLVMLIDVPCSELAQELSQSRVAVQGLQNTLQQVLDQREEARQSKQLLELYLRALEKEGSILLKQQESKAGLGDERDAVDTGIGESSSEIALTSQILNALKEKPAPELSLSSKDLELVAKEDPKALAVALNWDIKKTEAVQQTCNQELSLRLQQVQSLYSLRSISARRSSLPGEVQNPKQARRDPT
ncbi:DNA fragmentation factor subunit alpha isoform X1 [Delphinapterus leucas]|uniref:DNAation factor subunit alpha isoform X1 n=1 Tax=Delphinapterus leucas TaxID=9749 RepID=A0A2Y9QFT7_DELLE|nr:DNA fragmentation factor subunit alpha isoform X1 [Delphinapterus leucas]